MPSQQDPEQIRNALTREVTTDAYTIASQVFPGPQPDVRHVTNAQIDERYRQAFLNNERDFLMGEAGRDPTQFMASMARLGVTMPPGETIPQEPPLPPAARSNVPIPEPHPAAKPQTYASPDQVPSTPELPSPSMPPGPVPAGTPPVGAAVASAPAQLKIPPPAQPPY